MNTESLDKVHEALERFTTASLDLRKAHTRNLDRETHRVPKYFSGCPKEQGALRRASLDLSRALADLRRPS